MTEQEYRKHPAIANSDLSYIDRSQHHWEKYKEEGSEPTDAMEFGTLFHSYILEPEKFNSAVVTEEEFMLIHPDALKDGVPNRRLKVYQEWKKAIPKDKLLLQCNKMALLEGMKEKVYSHPVARTLLSMGGKTEEPIFWEYMGVKCKAKIDRLIETEDENIIVDLKKTQDCSVVEKTIINYEYYRQLAYYSLGMETLTGKPTRSILIFCEEEYPHGVTVVEISHEYIAVGRDRVNAILNKYKNFTPELPKTVYGEGLVLASPPEWLVNKITANV